MSKILKPIYSIVCFSLLFFSCSSEVEAEETSIEANVEDSLTSENDEIDSSSITCPSCDYTTVEELPTDVCLLSYDCKECGETMHPDIGDCCVFCTHGDVKCPSMQDDEPN